MGVDRPIDITAGQRKTILALLQRHLPGTAAWVYGSRATWTSRPQSDLDLVVFATPEQRRGVGNLREAFEESDLPFRVDLFVWDEVPETFRKEIETEHVVLVEGRDQDAASQQLFDALPEGWKYTTLGIACATAGGDIQTGPFGSQLHASDYVPSGIPSIMPQNIGDNRILANGISRITPDDASRLSRYLVRKGDIVYSRRGDVKRRALVRSAEEGWLCGTGCLRIRLGKTGVDSRYASYYLGHPDVQEWIARHAHGATMPNLNTSILSECPFVIPPKSEQRAIAQILGTLDDKTELNRRMNETLEAMARTLFKDWFVDFGPVRAKAEGRDAGLPQSLADLFPARVVDSDLGEIPEGWPVETLADRFEAVKGVSYKGSGLGAGGVPLHNLNSIYEGGGYKYEGIKYYSGEHAERHVVLPGDVIVANTEQGHERLLIGYAAVVPDFYGSYGIASHHIYRVRPKPRSQLKTSYLCWLLNSPQMHDVISGFANGTTVNMLPLDALQKPLMVCPPATLVEAFDALAANAGQRCEEMLSESRALAALRDLLLPKLISGEIRLREAEKAVGAVT